MDPARGRAAPCGPSAVATESAVGDDARMSEERRLVTVVFADVIGSTSLVERLDPEDARILLRRYFSVAKEVIEEHGGRVEKFIGDAVVAVFGLPRAHGDDAARGLAAALELRDRLRSDSKLGERLSIRFGANTGEVVATADGSAGDFLITGDAVNVAARLQQAAEPWAILAGERTARSAGDSFVFGPSQIVDVRGKAATTKALPVLGRAAAPRPARAPIVGRAADLAQLELVASRAFAERRPYLVSVIAPPGTGKTRLLEEFLERLPAIAPEARVAVAQCLPYGQRLTYWPLRAVLFRLMSIPDDARPQETLEAIRSRLRSAAVDSPETTAELLAATVGVSEGEVSDRAALFNAWRETLQAASRDAPVVLAFEDLHWSSDSLLELVEYVVQPRAQVPVLMLALSRPELLERRPAWGGGLRNSVSLALEPLSDAATAELVGHLLEGSAPELVHEVVARAEGNPFYAGEIVRAVLERVPSLDDHEAVAEALATLPDTVQATVLARLDLLPPHERRLLQLGSVFGRAFRLQGIVAVAPELAGEAQSLIDALVAKDLVRPGGSDRFAFRHILIRDVAYQTLPRAERARLHASAAGWLEERSIGQEDVLAEHVAYHYREAAALSSRVDPDAQEARDARRKASEWLLRAADVAAATAASVEAAAHLRSAIEVSDPDALPGLYERLGDVQLDAETSVEAYRQALARSPEARRSSADVLRLLGKVLTNYTRYQGSIANRPSRQELERLRDEGRSLLGKADDQSAIAGFLVAQAFLPYWDEAYTTPEELMRAQESARRALTIAQRLDDANLQSGALDALSSLAELQGAQAEAREHARNRLPLQDRLTLMERIDAYSMTTFLSASIGDLEEAEQVSRAGLAHVQPGQAPSWALHLLAWRAYALVLLGRWDDAIAAGERARDVWLEAHRGPGGHAIRGFVAALDVARARRDQRRVEEYSAIVREILAGRTDELSAIRSYLTPDLDALEAHVVRAFTFEGLPPDVAAASARPKLARAEHLERIVSLLADHRRPPPPEPLRVLIALADTHGHVLLAAQARRALGLRAADPSELSLALAAFERAKAVPYAARARCERSLIEGDRSELLVGLEVLERLGDVDQIERIHRAGARRDASG